MYEWSDMSNHELFHWASTIIYPTKRFSLVQSGHRHQINLFMPLYRSWKGAVIVVIIWYGSWIYNYLCNQCLSPVKLWVRIPLMSGALHATLYDQVCQWLVAGRWFSPGTPVSSTNKTDCHDIAEILLKVVLNTIPL